ncbi:MAG TPA: aminotransferase class I/II-fold pyridoxal phosphate-dependent enzyme [Kofleriaceae bacterium]|nr:aminotransferase class I/II-fold pyridoxal phosphate-dependent enzyme [Kofleriaceae bacterium]
MSQALRDLLRSETDRLKDAGLYKREVVFSRSGGMAAGGMVDGELGQSVVNYTTQDFLGLSVDPQLQQAAIDAIHKYGVGLSSQRVMCGTLAIHKELEDWLRGFLKVPDVMIYGSGYHANIGVFAPLFGARDCIICDGGVHPSLAEGARLAGARLVTFRSDDPDDLEDILRRSRWARFRAVVTNGVHPFTGRISDLGSICDLAEKYDAMVIVDDALGIGVLGDRGRGTAEHAGVLDRVHLITGTFSKALGGATGGFAAGSAEVIDWLRQKSSPYMFSAALPPAMAAVAMAALQILESGDAPLPHLRDNVRTLWTGLLERKFRVLGQGQHPLLVVEVGSYEILRETVNHLYDSGIYCHGLCYPVVPEGEARIRLMVSALHSADHIQQTLKAFESTREVASFAVDALEALSGLDG